MSKLTDRLDDLARRGLSDNDLCADQDDLAVHLADELRSLLPAHEAEIREQAQREQFNAHCAAACALCDAERSCTRVDGMDRAVVHAGLDAWWHPGHGYCLASPIRAAYAKAHREVKRG